MPPVAGWYSPGLHLPHSALPFSAAYRPASQMAQSLPDTEAWPKSQSVHSVAPAAPTVDLPASHLAQKKWLEVNCPDASSL